MLALISREPALSHEPLSGLPCAMPRTHVVQSLSMALWALPVLVAGAYLALSPVRAAHVQQSAAADFRPEPPAASETLKISPQRWPGSAELLQASRFERPAAAKHPARIVLDRTAPGPRTHTFRFRDVAVVDATHLRAEGMILTLAGVMPPDDGAMCKRIDGVMESCAERAASRLAVLVQGRTVVCRVTLEASGQPPQGECRAEKIDLVDDLVRLGLVRRISGLEADATSSRRSVRL